MPIRPENRARYPKNWQEIRQAILKRAGDRCERCGVPNHRVIVRGWGADVFVDDRLTPGEMTGYGTRAVRVVLTIAHLDHRPENCDPANLRAWCQKCHNSYDAAHRAAGRVERRKNEVAQLTLFDN